MDADTRCPICDTPQPDLDAHFKDSKRCSAIDRLRRGKVAQMKAVKEKGKREAEAFHAILSRGLEGAKVPTVTQLVSEMHAAGFTMIGRNSISRLCKVVGVNLAVLRAERGAQAMHLNPTVWLPEVTDQKWLDWHPLQLFDRLMRHFDGEPEEDAPFVENRETWVAWRVLIAAIFGLPQEHLARDWSSDDAPPIPIYPGVPTGVEVTRGAAELHSGMTAQEIYAACTGRATWPTWQSELIALIVGRRGGKSYITAFIGLYLACCRPYKLKLGTKGMVMILAVDRKQAEVIRTYIIAFAQALAETRALLKSDPTQSLIGFTNNVTIEVRALGDAGTRGYSVVGVLADEIAFWPTDETSMRQDKKVLNALEPATFGVKSRPGESPMVIMLSSPHAKKGELYDVYKRSYAKDDDRRAFVWHADTLSMRPTDDASLIAKIQTKYEHDPAEARAEYGAQFRNDLESIFTREAIEAVAEAGCNERPYNPRYAYRMFIDAATGSGGDSYAVAVAYDEEMRVGNDRIVVPTLAYVREWIPKFKIPAVLAEVIEIAKRYHITVATGDAFAGEFARDPLKRGGLGYVLSEMKRSELYLRLLPMVNSGGVSLLDVDSPLGKRMLNQACNLERRVGSSGRDSVDHPKGQHDDVINAVAGALVSGGTVEVEIGNLDIGVSRTCRPDAWRF